MNDPDAAYVTFRTRFNFERAWPALDPAWLARLQAKWTRLEAERVEAKRKEQLG